MEEPGPSTSTANQELLQQHEEIREGTFEWKIDLFLEKKDRIESPNFKFGRNEVCLYIPEVNKCPGSYYGMYVVNMYHAVVRGIRSFSSKTMHRLSLVDRCGRECLTLKGTTVKNPNLSLCFHKFYLHDHSETLLPGGTLTIRISWYPGDQKIKRGAQTMSVPSPEKLLVTLSKDFCNFYECKTNTDCVLRVGETKFPVHSAVLSARSTVFAAMFRQEISQNRSLVVDIPDVEAAALNDVLHYIYSGRIRGMTPNSAAPMYIIADKYAMVDLKDVSVDFLMHNLTIGNVCEVAILAQTYKEIELEEEIVQFIDENYEELEESEEWRLFTNTKPLHANKLLRSAYAACRKFQFSNKKIKKRHVQE